MACTENDGKWHFVYVRNGYVFVRSELMASAERRGQSTTPRPFRDAAARHGLRQREGGYVPRKVPCAPIRQRDGYIFIRTEPIDREAASSMVRAGVTANTTEENSRVSRESRLLCSHSHGESFAMASAERRGRSATPRPFRDAAAQRDLSMQR